MPSCHHNISTFCIYEEENTFMSSQHFHIKRG
jgi:hypothetical protein